MIMQLQLDIKESQGNGQHKVQEEYEALAQIHGSTIQRTPGPKRGLTTWVPNSKGELTRTPMYRKSLPFT